MNNVGIDHIATYVPNQYLSMEDLAQARGVEPGKYLKGIGIVEMSVPAPWEDLVVLAANAGDRALKEAGVSPLDVGLLIVGTESAEDKAKPTATHVHALLGISPSCRVYDVLHACAGATYGVLSALDWVSQPGHEHRHALVIATDIARYPAGSPGEPTQGAGAVAMIVSHAPRLMQLAQLSAFSSSVYDFWKPLDQEYPVVQGVYSVQCYLNAAKACFGAVDLNPNAAFIYHTPYPKLVEKIHAGIPGLPGEAEASRRHYAANVRSSTIYPARVGNTYTAGVWLAAVSLLETCYHEALAKGIEPALDARRYDGLYLFSYGSGCGAVLMRGLLRDTWPERVRAFEVKQALDRRQRLTVAEYEQLREGRTPSSLRVSGPTRFMFDGIIRHERRYSRTGLP